MAKKKNKVLVKLVSTASTGYFYVREKSTKQPVGGADKGGKSGGSGPSSKMEFMKYDPVIRKHVKFIEAKLSS